MLMSLETFCQQDSSLARPAFTDWLALSHWICPDGALPATARLRVHSVMSSPASQVLLRVESFIEYRLLDILLHTESILQFQYPPSRCSNTAFDHPRWNSRDELRDDSCRRCKQNDRASRHRTQRWISAHQYPNMVGTSNCGQTCSRYLVSNVTRMWQYSAILRACVHSF